MAITIDIEPERNALVSTLLPIYYKCTEATADTTNLVAKCFWIDQTTLVETQVGGEYRLAPSLENSDEFKFDASEIFNSLTKYTLEDMPSIRVGEKVNTLSNTLINWKDVATWYVKVKFYREYLDSTTGLIVLDPSPEVSEPYYVHEGCPDQQWLTTAVETNGGNNYSVFKYFRGDYDSLDSYKRWLTNTPMSSYNHSVNIDQNESYIVNFFAPLQTTGHVYRIQIKTYDISDTLLNTHELTPTESNNLQTFMCGFRDIKNGLTEGGTESSGFANVEYYKVYFNASSNTSAPYTYDISLSIYTFHVKRKCLGKGYLRFAFKNMLGGFDMVTSNGKFTKTSKSKLETYEQSLGYLNWNNPMKFGGQNWATEETVEYRVVTEPMKRENAEHFAEMFNSTNVYLREKSFPFGSVYSVPLKADTSDIYPYVYNPIQMLAGTATLYETTNQLVQLKFKFIQAVNQRTPRY